MSMIKATYPGAGTYLGTGNDPTDDDEELGPDLFDRFPGEPVKAYAYFKQFCEMGPGRKVKKLSEKVNKSTAYFYKLASGWQWKARAAAYDAAEDQAVQIEIRAQRVRLSRQQLAVATGYFHWTARYLSRMTDDKLDEMTPGEVAKWTTAASTLFRVALGEPDQRIALGTGDAMGGFRPLAQMSEGERRAELGTLLADIGRRFANGEQFAGTDEEALLALLSAPEDLNRATGPAG